MSDISILQVASFSGNVGDNANHNGTFARMRCNTTKRISINQLEIRKTYLNYHKYDKWAFDRKFVDKVNQSELCLIGGGNYLELWLDQSATGTTLDIDLEMLNQITTPTVFYALGCDIGNGTNPNNISRFCRFLDAISENSNLSICVRNDGSRENIKSIAGALYSDQIQTVPDGGFFVETDVSIGRNLVSRQRMNIAINLAGDMLKIRFPGGEDDLESFLQQLVTVCNKLVDEYDANIIFIPHIYKDIGLINRCLAMFNDYTLRTSVSVAPYLNGPGSEKIVFGIYQSCDLVLATRFHASVCPLGLGVPTIGLCCYPQIEGLYRELDLLNWLVHVNRKNYADHLMNLCHVMLDDPHSIRGRLGHLKSELIDQIDAVQKSILGRV